MNRASPAPIALLPGVPALKASGVDLKEENGIQGMRGFSASLVVMYHIAIALPAVVPLAILYSGYSGVEFFFLISGYILARKFEAGDYSVRRRFSKLKYYFRRVFRIWPLYFLTIPIYAMTMGMPIIWQDFLFLQNYLQSTFMLYPYWTLVIEELFYLILPLWVASFRRNWRASLVSAAGFTFAYAAYLALVLHAQEPSMYQYAQFPVFALTYALGTVAAYRKTVRLHWAVVVLAWLAASFALPAASSNINGFAWQTPAIFSIIYFLVLSNLKGSWFFTNRVSVYLGSLTYPIYLVSVPVEVVLVQTFYQWNIVWVPLTIICTLCAAYLLHRFVELPLIAAGRRLEAKYLRA